MAETSWNRRNISSNIVTLIGIVSLIGTLIAVSAKYAKFDAGYEQNIKEHTEIKASTTEAYIELKKEMNKKFDEQQKQNTEIIRALGRIEGKLEN